MQLLVERKGRFGSECEVLDRTIGVFYRAIKTDSMTYPLTHTHRLVVLLLEPHLLEPFPWGQLLGSPVEPLEPADVVCNCTMDRSNFHNSATPHNFASIVRSTGCSLDLARQLQLAAAAVEVQLDRSYFIQSRK
jgi:hypothetical protein